MDTENTSTKTVTETQESSDTPFWQQNDHSTLFGVSLRGWIALIVVLTVCIMSFAMKEIKEPLYTLAGLIVGFYFGANPKKNNNSY